MTVAGNVDVTVTWNVDETVTVTVTGNVAESDNDCYCDKECGCGYATSLVKRGRNTICFAHRCHTAGATMWVFH